MQTRLSDTYKDTPLGQTANQVLRSCVHCGFCNATCPTYQLLGDELDGPRGRIYQIKQVLEGVTATAGIQQHLDRCLTCRACETTCPSGVEYHRLLDIGRELVEQQVARPFLQRNYRRLLQYTFGNTQRVALLLFFARLIRPMLPVQIKKRIPLAKRIRPPGGQAHARTMLLLDGCVQPAALPQINDSAIAVFDRLAISLRIIAAAGCCGALHQHLADGEAARQRARANIDAWWPHVQQGAEAIVITASGCAPMVKDYGHLLAGDTQYAQRAAHIGAMTRDISEVLRDEDLGGLKTESAGRIAFHSPCSLQHAQQLDGVVETLLTSAGYSLVPVRDSHLCCGSAGTYSILQPKLAKRLRSRKLDALQEKRPELIATANIGCLLHLQQTADLPVRHWIELLASA